MTVSPTYFLLSTVMAVSLAVVVALVTLHSLAQKFRPTGEYDDEGNWKWNDDGPDAQDNQVLFAARWMMFVLVLGTIFVVVSAIRIAVVASKSASTTVMSSLMQSLTHWNLARMAGSLFMYGYMAFLCCFYFADFGQNQGEDDEQDRNDNRSLQNYENNQEQQQQEEYQEGYAQKIMSRHSLGLFLIFAILSATLMGLACRFESTGAGVSMIGVNLKDGFVKDDTRNAHTQIIYDTFKFLSAFAIATLGMTSAMALVTSLFVKAEEGERKRMQEEGSVINFTWINVWMLVLVIVMTALGYQNLSQDRTTSPLKFCFFQGCLYLIPFTAIFITALYSGFSFRLITSFFSGEEEDRHRHGVGDKGVIGSFLLSSCCFSLAVFYAFIAFLLTKYQISILGDASTHAAAGEKSLSYYKEMNEEDDPTSAELRSGPWRKSSPNDPPIVEPSHV